VYLEGRAGCLVVHHMVMSRYPLDPERLGPLVALLRDPHARVDERDDAAIDLRDSDDPLALRALLEAASDPGDDPAVVEMCGESIAVIWVRIGGHDAQMVGRLRVEAQRELLAVLRERRPDWLT
jgi:hypothetical protein